VKEARLAQLAVTDDIDAGLCLLCNDIANYRANPALQCGCVEGWAGLPLSQKVEEVGRARKAARMGRENPAFTTLHPTPP
jgi:hypothetical protein